MSTRRAYCDHNATAPIRPEAAEAVARALMLGNPSSVHQEGRAARDAVEQARADVAALVGVAPSQVIFTSGGTEAAAMALRPVSDDEVLFVGAAEHACVRAGGQFARDRIAVVPVDADGRIDFAELDLMVGARGLLPGQVHVAVQIANNETGVINDPAVFAAMRAKGWTVTADAVQALGKASLEPYFAGVDFLLLSAHKIGGPKGAGALITRGDGCGSMRPFLSGGGQERGMRAGTENVPGIAGFGAAARVVRLAGGERGEASVLRDAFEVGLRRIAPEAVVFSAGVARLGNTSLFAIPGFRAETALIAFDLDGVAVSSGSACSSGKVAKSHVLAAMGVADDLSAAAIRISFGWSSTQEDVTQVLNSLERQLARLRTRRDSAA